MYLYTEGDQFHHTDLVTVRFDNDDSGIYYYCNPIDIVLIQM